MALEDKILTAIEKTRLMGDWRRGCLLAGMSDMEAQEAWDDPDTRAELLEAESHIDELLMENFLEALPVAAAKGNIQGILQGMAKRMPDKWGERGHSSEDVTFDDYIETDTETLRDSSGLEKRFIE